MRATRAATLGGLLATAVIAVWWLAATHEALATAGAAPLIARAATAALWLLEALTLAIAAPRLGAVIGVRQSLPVLGSFMITPAPLLALLWAASGASAGRFAAATAGLAAAAGLLSLLGALLERHGALAARAIPVATLIGVAVAGLAFRLREVWVAWLA